MPELGRAGRNLVAVLACLLAFSAEAQEEESVDSVLSGFDSTTPEQGDEDPLEGFDDFQDTVVEAQPPPAARNWEIRGDASLSAAYHYAYPRPEPGEPDYRGLSQLRLQLRPELVATPSPDWDLKISASLFYDAAYQLAGRNQFPDQLLRHQESEAEFRDTYLRGSLGTDLDLKLGRQIVAWGKSDNLRVVDVLNPLDLRTPGQTDIEDLRLPVTMVRGDYYRGNWNMSLVAIPEIRFDKIPVYGSAYYPGQAPAPMEEVPHDGGSNTEYALALQGVLTGWDIALHLARIFDDEAHLAVQSGELRREHSRLDMAGISANVALGNWLLKAESAHLDGKQYLAAPGEYFARTDILAGAEYSGFDNVSLTLETAVRHIHDYRNELAVGPVGVERNTWESALRYSGDYWRERLNLTLLVVRRGASLDDGGFTRMQFAYELRQALELTLGAVLYHSADSEPYATFSDNDRLFLRLEYDF